MAGFIVETEIGEIAQQGRKEEGQSGTGEESGLEFCRSGLKEKKTTGDLLFSLLLHPIFLFCYLAGGAQCC